MSEGASPNRPATRPRGVHEGRHYVRPPAARPRTATLPGIAAWLRAEALDIGSPIKLVDALCWRLVAAGLPVDRGGITVALLHPQFSGYGIRWWREPGEAEELLLEHDVPGSEAFRRSPYPPVVERGEIVRVRIDPGAAEQPYPVIADLAAQGYTDYVALPVRLRARSASGRERRFQACNFATRHPAGFSEADIRALARVAEDMAAPLAVVTERRMARDILAAYLGRSVAPRVLSGEVTRGSGEAVSAAILTTDMRGFTALVDRLPGPRVIELLNAWFAGQVEAVHAQGGEVLKFMGDGMLAIFPFRDGASAAGAAARALVAARASLDWARALDADPAFADARPLRAVAALHAGDVFHGNIGAPGRLDFTAIGPGLNLVSRLEALAKALGRDLVLSADFAALCGGRFESLGHHALRGVATPVEAFACAPEE